jgi:ubiquinone/menaquinone biosynthesis C-methylase UbiE
MLDHVSSCSVRHHEYAPDELIAAERALRDHEAATYDANRERDAWELEVEEACLWRALELERGQTVIDAGCATGLHLPKLLDTAEQVIGIDHSERSLERARGRLAGSASARVRLHRADLRSLPVADQAADRVLCCQAIQHIPTAERRSAVARELRRVLRPGGLLVVTGYRWLGHLRRRKEGLWGPLYYYAFSAREFGQLFKEAGFAKVEVGGTVILPRLAKLVRMPVETQTRLAFTALGRHLADYVIVRAWRAPVP